MDYPYEIIIILLAVGGMLVYHIYRCCKNYDHSANYKYVSSNIPELEEQIHKRHVTLYIRGYKIMHSCGGVCDTRRIGKKYNLYFNIDSSSIVNRFMYSGISFTDQPCKTLTVKKHTEYISCSNINELDDVDIEDVYHVTVEN